MQEEKYDMNDVEYAGFWIRVLACFVDSLILTLIAIPIGAIFGFAAATFILTGNEDGTVWVALMGNLIGWIISTLYYVLLVASRKQGTFGKQFLGLKVVDENGERISKSRSLGRFLSSMISSLLLYIGYIMVAFHPKKRGLHDIIAGTYVIKTK